MNEHDFCRAWSDLVASPRGNALGENRQNVRIMVVRMEIKAEDLINRYRDIPCSEENTEIVLSPVKIRMRIRIGKLISLPDQLLGQTDRGNHAGWISFSLPRNIVGGSVIR